ncbi:MAG: S8 family serine peptidase, partial [bacterium]|nr:S8 family serine peptidase [bacterium]
VGWMSFGEADQCPGSRDQFGNRALGEALDNYRNRESAFTAASGNDLTEVELPGNHPDVAGLGALATDGTHWDRRNRPEDCPGDTPSLIECGSNYTLDLDAMPDPDLRTLDLVPPGQFVLATVFTRFGYGGPNPPDPDSDRWCGDQYPTDADSGNDGDGYGSCTGTSMSSPYVAGVLGLLRTANPLLTRWQLLQVLTETASGSGVWDQYLGYGVPDAAAA